MYLKVLNVRNVGCGYWDGGKSSQQCVVVRLEFWVDGCKKISLLAGAGILRDTEKGRWQGFCVPVFSFGGVSSCGNRSFLMFRKGIRVSRTNGTWGISLWEVGVLTQVSQFRRFEQEGKASEKICALKNLCCVLGKFIVQAEDDFVVADEDFLHCGFYKATNVYVIRSDQFPTSFSENLFTVIIGDFWELELKF